MTDVLPPLYQRWINELLPTPVPPEERATCTTCAMLPRPGEPVGKEGTFHPSSKCCTWYPDLSNFHVGAILADESPEAAAGREIVQKRMASGVAMTPLALQAPPVYQLLYDHSVAAQEGSFGRVTSMRCPYYVDGNCGVWRHRDAICATWYCKFMRGARGALFWQLMKALLRTLEGQLRFWCVTRLDLDADAMRAVLVSLSRDPKGPLDERAMAGQADPRQYARMWGSWQGREADFYMACARLVDGLSWEQVLAIGGGQAAFAADVLREFHVSLQSASLPERVGRSQALVQIGPGPNGLVRVRNRTVPYDPLDVAPILLTMVQRVEQGSLADAVAAMRATGVPLDDAAVRKLLDYELLVPA